MNAGTHTHPPESGREPGDASDGVLVVHPHTGEVFADLASTPPEHLADALASLRAHQSDVRKMEQAVATELQARLSTRQRKLWLVGEYEVRLDTPNESVWDADELEIVLQRLVDEGVVTASECTDVIKRETTVSRSAAKRLLSRLSGPAARAVKECVSWQPSSRSRLTVERSQPLIPE